MDSLIKLLKVQGVL